MSSNELVPIRLNQNGSIARCCSERGAPITLCHICNGVYYVEVPKGSEVFGGAGTRDNPWTSIRQIQYEFDPSGKQLGYSQAYLEAYAGCEVHIYASGIIQYRFNVSSTTELGVRDGKIITYLHAEDLILSNNAASLLYINIYGLTIKLDEIYTSMQSIPTLAVYYTDELKRISFDVTIKVDRASGTSSTLMRVDSYKNSGCVIEDLNIDIDCNNMGFTAIVAENVKSLTNVHVTSKLSGYNPGLNCGTIRLVAGGKADNIQVDSDISVIDTTSFSSISIVDSANSGLTAEITNIRVSNSMHLIGDFDDVIANSHFGAFTGALIRNIEVRSIGGKSYATGVSTIVDLQGFVENMHIYHSTIIEGDGSPRVSAGFYLYNYSGDVYVKNSTFIVDITTPYHIGHLYQYLTLDGIVENCSFAVNGGTAFNVIGGTNVRTETLAENCSFVYGATPYGRNNSSWYNVCAYNDKITFNNCAISGQGCYACRYDWENWNGTGEPDVICTPCEVPCETM